VTPRELSFSDASRQSRKGLRCGTASASPVGCAVVAPPAGPVQSEEVLGRGEAGDRGGRRGLGLEGWPSTWRAGRTASSRAPRSFAARGAGRDNRGAMAQTLGYVLVVLLIVYIAYAVDRRLVRHLVRVRVGRGSGFRACGRPSRASCQPRVGRPSRALSSSPFLGRTGPRRTLRDPRLRIRAVSRAASSADHAHPAAASASSWLG
jgi:hypothetical protein